MTLNAISLKDVSE